MDPSAERAAGDHRVGGPDDPGDGSGGTYAERLATPWWLWLGGLAGAVGLAAEVHLGYAGSRAWLPYAVAVPVTVGVLWWLGRVRVAVVDGELRVDDAHIPVALLAAAEPVDRAGLREALGRDLDPVAFVVHRPWVRGAVRVYLDDPADPTPYWVVSTRRPTALLDALDLPRPAPPAGAPGG
jgi:hypothetical protein